MSEATHISSGPAGPANEEILRTAEMLRWQVGPNFHDQLMEEIYAEAANLADRAVTWPEKERRFDLDHTIDRIEKIAAALEPATFQRGASLLGPAPCPIARWPSAWPRR